MPRALTEQEKCKLCQRLLEKGRDLALIHGIKKISVDDISNSAGMAKGSFYHHFDSKEKFLYELILDIRRQIFNQAKIFIKNENDKKETIRRTPVQRTQDFLMNLFHMPQMKFFLKNCSDINEIFNSGDRAQSGENRSACYIDADMFGSLIKLSGIDTGKIKSGIVHNYIHTLHLMMECEFMINGDLPQTFDLIMGSLIQYLFNNGSNDPQNSGHKVRKISDADHKPARAKQKGGVK